MGDVLAVVEVVVVCVAGYFAACDAVFVAVCAVAFAVAFVAVHVAVPDGDIACWEQTFDRDEHENLVAGRSKSALAVALAAVAAVVEKSAEVVDSRYVKGGVLDDEVFREEKVV